jgi:hypothetical protein
MGVSISASHSPNRLCFAAGHISGQLQMSFVAQAITAARARFALLRNALASKSPAISRPN